MNMKALIVASMVAFSGTAVASENPYDMFYNTSIVSLKSKVDNEYDCAYTVFIENEAFEAEAHYNKGTKVCTQAVDFPSSVKKINKLVAGKEEINVGDYTYKRSSNQGFMKSN